MDKLKAVIDQYGRWLPIEEYIQRIEAFKENDFSIAIENSKSLLESIAKEICAERGQAYEENDSPAKLMKLAFGSIGVQASDIGPQIATALSNIGQNVGQLRNEIGVIAHGRTMEELQTKKEIIDQFTRDFLLQSIEIIACFMIQFFEWKYPRISSPTELKIDYNDCGDFNEFWDDIYGDYAMGDYSYASSEILFYVDKQAYSTEYKAFKREK